MSDAETMRRLADVERQVLELERSQGAREVRPAIGGGGGAATLHYYFPAIPTTQTEVIQMQGCDFAATPDDPDIIPGSGGGFVWHPGVIDGFWWASPGDEFWKPLGGKLAFHRGRPGTYYIWRADVN